MPLEASCGDPEPQARLGTGRSPTQRLQRSPDPLLKKNHKYISGEYKSTQQVQPHPQRGYHRYAQDKSRIRLRFICSKARFYTCRGLFFKRVFSKRFITNRVISGVDPTQRIQVLMLLDSSSAVAHGTTAGHFPKQLTLWKHPTQKSSCATIP